MTDDADDLDRRLARLFEAGRREDPEEHPSPEKLSAYQANELPPGEADAIQEHLAECTLCAELLLDLQRFLEPVEEERPGVTDLAAEAEWRKVRKEMGWEGRKSLEAPAAEVSRLRRSLRAFQTMAAMLLAGVVGLSLYALHVRAELKAPRPNTVSEFVPSKEGVRSTDLEPALIELPRGEKGGVTLTLEGGDGPDYPEYRAEIRRRRGESLPSVTGLQRQDNDFGLTLDAEGLEPGLYEIEVYGLGKGPPVLVEKYAIQVERN